MLCDAKGKDERKNRNVIRASWKRERERDTNVSPLSVCARRDAVSPPPVFLPPHSPPSPPPPPPPGSAQGQCEQRTMAENNANNNNNNSGANNAAAIVARRQQQHDDSAAVKKHRAATDKMEPMFTVPLSPGPPVAPGSSLPPTLLPSTLNHSHKPLPQVRTRSVGTNTQDGGPVDGDQTQLGPCQPGTSVNLEGIVWHETQEGVLVVNVTWRKRTYVGTLLDCTKHNWAPPRFCESPSSDPEMPGGRGRGKRMRLAMTDRSCIDSSPAAKVRGLTQHRSRGGGANASIHNKGRRGSLNLINSNCRSTFFTVEDVKPANNLSSGKRKNKPPADLDLTMVGSEDIKNANGKRIRAKSRSAPSTPQGKNDPSFMDPGGGCTSSLPILIDCPHPNCTKRYKHINGLRYHQTHAHLEVEEQRKPDLEPMKDADSEDRLSDCEDGMVNMNYNLSETSSKKPTPLYKVTTVGSPKNRRLLLSTDQSSNSKNRRTSILKDGLIDDLSNLPIISNMTVVLENCMVPDRNSTVEMPKLEAEGLINKKGKKANGKVEKLSKSRTNRPIAPAPAPPKLIAIPNTAYANTGSENATTQQQPLGLTSKNLSLKPIKPKLSIVVEPSLVKATLVGCNKETKKKEKRRLKDKHNKDSAARTANGDNSGNKMDENGNGSKMTVKEISGSLLKEHLSKQEVLNGLSESQESRMASIRAEADKVYTFTDNAPSPSIGGSSRLDASGCCLTSDNDSKNNSPAYSDISDAGDDGGSNECRSKSGSSEVSVSSNHSNSGKTPAKDNPQSPYYHGYDPYYLQGYMQSERQSHKSVKDWKEEAKDIEKTSTHEFSECKKSDGPPQSQVQLAMSQTALAQSLYYGQYSRGLYMDQKLLLASKCCDPKQRGQLRESDDIKHIIGGSTGKDGVNSKSCCPKPVHAYVELNERGERVQQSLKDNEDVKSSVSQTDLDSNVSFASPSDNATWAHHFVHGKYSEEEEEGATAETGVGASKPTPQQREAKKAQVDSEDTERLEEQSQEPLGVLCEESQSARAAVSPPSPPQQPYTQYQHPPYAPYLSAMCEGSGGSYRGVSPTLVHSYPGFHYPLYGKTAGREESEGTPTRGGAVSSKQSSDSNPASALELMPQSHQFHGKSFALGEKGSPEAERDSERERNHMSFARHLHTHHHTHLGMSYSVMSNQYDIYQGLNSRSLVSGQQVSGHSSTESEGKK